MRGEAAEAEKKEAEQEEDLTSSSNTSICHYTKGDSHQVQKRGRKGGGCLS